MNKYFPKEHEFNKNYLNIKKFENFSIKGIIKYRNKKIKGILNSISIQKIIYLFEEKPINIKNIIQSLIDCERKFIYLALLILRYNNNIIFPSLNHNINITQFNLQNRSFKSLKKELFSLYNSTYYFFENLSLKELQLSQSIQDNNFSVRAIAYILCSKSIDYATLIKKIIIKKK